MFRGRARSKSGAQRVTEEIDGQARGGGNPLQKKDQGSSRWEEPNKGKNLEKRTGKGEEDVETTT